MPRAARGARNLALLLLATLAGCGSEPPPRPNVLIVTLDTLRADRMGCYGGERDTTPHIDAFAAGGVRFEQAFAASSFTPPTHASILTSRWPAEHGLQHWNKALAAEVPTAAEIFAAAGYRTGAFTPMVTLLKLGLQRGFQTAESPPYRLAGSSAVLADADAVNALALPWLTAGAAGGTAGASDTRGADSAGSATESTGAAPADPARQPFFAWVHYYDAHRPYGRQGPEWSGRFAPHDDPAIGATEAWYQLSPEERAALDVTPEKVTLIEDHYDGGLAYLDERVGRLLEGLRAAGVLENTIVVLIADHGEVFDEYVPEWFSHDPYLMDENTHIPFLLRLPGGKHAGLVSSAPASQVDVLPTLLDLCGIAAPAGQPLSGLSLRPLLQGGRPPRELVFADRIGDDLSGRKSAKAPTDEQVRASRDHQRSVRSATHLLVHYEDRGSYVLYAVDGSAPADEDVSARDPAARAGLLAAYLQWRHGLRLPRASSNGSPRAEDEELLSPEDKELLQSLGYTGEDTGQ